MKDKGGMAVLTGISLFCVAVFALAGYGIFRESNPGLPVSVRQITLSPAQEPAKPSAPQESTETTALAEESGESVPAAAEPILGKIVEEFMNPFHASYESYNRVSVKNRSGYALDLQEILGTNPALKIQKNDQPQVLIVHTHTTECYMNRDADSYTEADATRSENPDENTVSIGEEFARVLRENGIATVHDPTVHDSPAYTGSYARSRQTVLRNLEEYPSIRVIIDLHRDSVSLNDTDKVKPVAEIEGQKTAQVMLVMGCGEEIAGYENWKQNFGFAAKYQQTMAVLYPGLARAICLVNCAYNQDLSPGFILLEVGTEANSHEEAVRAAQFSARALASFLNTLQ